MATTRLEKNVCLLSLSDSLRLQHRSPSRCFRPNLFLDDCKSSNSRTPPRLNFCSLVSVNNMPKSTTPHSPPPTLLETSASYLMNTSLFPTRSHLSPNLAITISVSFAVSVHTSIPKQPPSPLPLFTPSSTTATLFITTCPSVRSPGSQQFQNSLARAVVKAPKFSHTTASLPVLRSLHWLKITERIEYKLLSSSTKFSQPPNLHICITSSQFSLLAALWSHSLAHPHHLLYEKQIVPSSMLPLVCGINSRLPSVNLALICPILPHPVV